MANGKAPAGEQGGRKPPKTSTNVKGSGRAAPVRGKDDVGLDELFVDPAPSKANKRASDRRRERGQAPPSPGVPDTATSLRQEKKPSRPPTRGGEVNARVLARATLTCTRGPEEGLTLNLTEGSYTVGRARENSFVLKDIAASRQHLRIEVDARGARVVDLGSGNGTRLNGKRVAEQPLHHGDRIEIGGSVLLYAETGRPAAKEGAIDDAQERVIRAAEKLAAELSERMRFGEEASESASFEDGHVARTRAVPQEVKPKATEQGRRPATKAQQLWKETFTNLPLDQVVPADQPLRGGGPFASASRNISMEPVSLSAPPQRAPLPRPPPLPLPLPPEEEISLSTSRNGGGSQLLSILVTALVVVVVGGGIAVLWMFRGAGQAAEEQVMQDFAQAMRKAELAAAAGDWLTTYEAATMALQLKPNDPIAATYQRDARNRLDKGSAAPAPPAPAPVIPPPVAAPTPALVPAPAPVIPAAPAPAPVATTPAAAPAPVAAAPAPAPVAAPIPPTPQPEAVPEPAPPPVKRSPPREASPPKATPPPAPRPKPVKRGAMSEAEAQTQFEEAVGALRERDNKRGCSILSTVAAKAPAGSLWKEKAENLLARRCD
ncbi:MAG: FHA domain-containing protein [Deltaproteobacteria bacterium]|nr:FHA domain-containing protein [Deltaproteobacteria bacterium]